MVEISGRFGAVGFLLASAFGLLLGCGGVDEAEEVGSPEAGVVEKGAPEAEVATVTRLAAEFMQALSTHDTENLDRLLARQAMFYSVRDGEEGPVFGARTRESFLEGIGEDSRALLERIWDPVVEVSGRVAMVWAPYDFHLNGEFSHCGIDVLTFLRLEDGWKVTSITYNVVGDGCAPSPLGEPVG